MRRRYLLAVLPFAVLATAAAASEPHTTAGQNVDLSPMALPIVVDGRLVNYVFVNIRINLTATADIIALRAHEPYFRDILIRAGHRAPFTRADDYTRIDQARLKAVLMQAVVAFAGPRAVTSIVVVSETPRRRDGLPRPPSAPAPSAAR